MLSYYKRRLLKKRLFKIFIVAVIMAGTLFLLNCCNNNDIPNLSDQETDRYMEESPTINLKRCSTGNVEVMKLDDYIIGVVAREMPNKFHQEALKAQAIVARTYTMAKVGRSSGNSGVMCDDYNHCQAYMDQKTMKEEWGDDYEIKYNKIRSAVMGTAGLILTYNGEIPSTPYSSTCGGKTASAKEVWGRDYPYLQSVSCKWDQDAPKFESTVKIQLDDLKYILLDQGKPVFSGGNKSKVIPKIIDISSSGRAIKVKYGDKIYKGTEFRSMLKLNSTKIKMSVNDDTLIINTTGHGHGVGMCQYGANGMALQGYHHLEILDHYFHGTKIEQIKNIKI